MSKSLLYVGASVGGIAGGALGGMLDNGNFLGMWGILLSTVGGLLGVYAAYKIQQ